MPGSHRDPVFIFFLLGILLTQALAGLRPAVLVTILSLASLIHLASPELHASSPVSVMEEFRLGSFLVAIVAVLGLHARDYLSQWRARRWRRMLEGDSPGVNMTLFEWDGWTGEMVWSDRLHALRDLRPGDTFEDRVVPSDLPRVHHDLRRSLETGVALETRFRMRGADESERWLAVSARFLRRKRSRWMLGTVSDVTELEQARRCLEADEERFELAQRAARMALWEWKPTEPAVRWMAGSGAVFGHSTEPLTLTVEQFLQRVHPGDRALVRKIFSLTPFDDGNEELEYRMEWPDGSQHWMLTRRRVISDHYGWPERVVGVTMEVTGRKQAEEALRISEQLAANGRLAATLAHEINNPLHSLGSLLFLMEQRVETEEVKRYLELGQNELAHATEIVRHTLGLYRQAQEIADVSPVDEVEQVISMCRRRLERECLEVETRYDYRGTLAVRPGEIRQSLTNLVLNAFDAGATRICIHIYEARTTHSGGAVRIAVSDNGSGIPPSVRNRLFEPFVTSKGQQGTGLGLWVIRGIMEKYGGEVRVRSRSGGRARGTTFLLMFPGRDSMTKPPADVRPMHASEEDGRWPKAGLG